MAAKTAMKEREELIYEDNIKSDSIAQRPPEMSENEINIDKLMLPDLHRYALDFLEYTYQDQSVLNLMAIDDNKEEIKDNDECSISQNNIDIEEENDINEDVMPLNPGYSDEDNKKLTKIVMWLLCIY